VVADEVRNLAMRAAEAARNTANLIEGTVTKVQAGSELVDRTSEAFSQAAVSAGKAKDLVSEIAAASQEQAHGVSMINKSITEMDQVVQRNAANSEESAGASQELNAQAEMMKGLVGDLVSVVGGINQINGNLKARGKIEMKHSVPLLT
jgi:methyl-accepting chemotaxis protein